MSVSHMYQPFPAYILAPTHFTSDRSVPCSMQPEMSSSLMHQMESTAMRPTIDVLYINKTVSISSSNVIAVL